MFAETIFRFTTMLIYWKAKRYVLVRIVASIGEKTVELLGQMTERG